MKLTEGIRMTLVAYCDEITSLHRDMLKHRGNGYKADFQEAVRNQRLAALLQYCNLVTEASDQQAQEQEATR